MTQILGGYCRAEVVVDKFLTLLGFFSSWLPQSPLSSWRCSRGDDESRRPLPCICDDAATEPSADPSDE